MAAHLQIRNLPDEIHETLRQRAANRGMSLRQYALQVLREHCQRPTLDEWLDGLDRLAADSALDPVIDLMQAEGLREEW